MSDYQPTILASQIKAFSKHLQYIREETQRQQLERIKKLEDENKRLKEVINDYRKVKQ